MGGGGGWRKESMHMPDGKETTGTEAPEPEKPPDQPPEEPPEDGRAHFQQIYKNYIFSRSLIR